jgi:hypothetical protein
MERVGLMEEESMPSTTSIVALVPALFVLAMTGFIREIRCLAGQVWPVPRNRNDTEPTVFELPNPLLRASRHRPRERHHMSDITIIVVAVAQVILVGMVLWGPRRERR